MNETKDLIINDQWIVSHRGDKNSVDPRRPYAWIVEKERTVNGSIEDTAIIFLTNRECSFHCLMCDLWKNTTDITVPAGAIPEQIEWALERMPGAKHLKLYNSGSFFDGRAIPEEDYPRIASLVSHFETVIVESHPKLIGERCLSFRDMLKPLLHVALGLETVNTDLLLRLNKKMTLQDFAHSVSFLKSNEILTRAFVLLRPPFLTEQEGIYWAERSLDFAFRIGVECCTVIPVREGNGAMDHLMEQGHFSKPDIRSLEAVLEYGIGLNSGRVFADLWDLNLFSTCPKCFDRRAERMNHMNLNQVISAPVECTCSQ
ncbi:MAG: radical SAM protein [Bacteroidales bacterium]|nr:radical SAM protein [Bacteroidales bacterium]